MSFNYEIDELDDICCNVCHHVRAEKCEDCPMFDENKYECRISTIQNILEDIATQYGE